MIKALSTPTRISAATLLAAIAISIAIVAGAFVSNEAPYSVELGIAEVSSAEGGTGYAVPASGSSNTNCTTEQICTGNDHNEQCDWVTTCDDPDPGGGGSSCNGEVDIRPSGYSRVWPTNLEVGETGTFITSIRNRECEDISGSFSSRLQIDKIGVGADCDAGTSYAYNPACVSELSAAAVTTGLNSDENKQVSIDWIPTEPGQYRISYYADTNFSSNSYGDVDEENENNNATNFYDLDVSYPPPSVALLVDKAAVAYNGSVQLNWILSGGPATGCTADSSDGSWTGDKAFAVGPHYQSVGSLTDINTTFTINCEGPGGSDSSTVSVHVVQPAVASIEACRWDGSNATDCVGSAETLLIAQGDEIVINWTGGNDASTTCSALSGKDFNTNDRRSGNDYISSLTTADSPERYEVECTNLTNTDNDYVDIEIGNRCMPLSGLEGPELVRAGNSFAINWQKPVDIATCVIAGGSISVGVDRDEPARDQCAIEEEYPVSISNATEFTMSCDYPPINSTIEIQVIPQLEEL